MMMTVLMMMWCTICRDHDKMIAVMTVLMMRWCTICSRGPAEWFPLALASSLLPKNNQLSNVDSYDGKDEYAASTDIQLRLYNFTTFATKQR